MTIKKFTAPLLLPVLLGGVTTACSGHKGYLEGLSMDATEVVQAPKHVQRLDRCIQEVAIKKASLEDVIALIKDKGLKDPAAREYLSYTKEIVNLDDTVLRDDQLECLNNINLVRIFLYDLSILEYFEGYLKRIRDNWHTVSPKAVNNLHKEVALLTRQEQLHLSAGFLMLYMACKHPKAVSLDLGNDRTAFRIEPNAATPSKEEEKIFELTEAICKKTNEREITPESLMEEIIQPARDICQCLEGPKFLLVKYSFNTLQLYFNIEKAVQSFFEAQFPEGTLGPGNYEMYDKDKEEEQSKELVVSKFWSILNKHFKDAENITCKLETSHLLPNKKEELLKRVSKYCDEPDKVVKLLALLKEERIDPAIKQALAAKIPEKSKEAKSTTAVATTATKPKTQSEPVVQTSKQEAPLSNQEVQNSTSHTEALAADTALPSSSCASEVPEDEVTEDFNAWHEAAWQRQEVGPPSTEGPSQQKQAKIPVIKDNRAGLFLDVVLGRSKYQPLRRGHFNAFLKAVGGKKLSMTQNGYITIPLADTTVETKYWVPNLADDAALNFAVCTIHQPHGNDPFPKLTINHFFKRQLAERGYGKLVSENEE